MAARLKNPSTGQRPGVPRPWVPIPGVPRPGVPRPGYPDWGYPDWGYPDWGYPDPVIILNHIKTSYSKHQKLALMD